MNVRDGAAYLHEALDSVLAQTLADWECVVVDDGSRDDTGKILRSYAERDARFRLLRNKESEGIYVSANRGLRAARGAYVARLDADDIWEPRKLELQKAYLDLHPGAVLVCSNWIWESEARGMRVPSMLPDSDILSAWFLLFYNHFACQSAVMFRRDAALDIGGYNERLPVTGDYELWVRLGRGHRLGVLSDVLVRFRRDLPGGVTVTRPEQQRHVATLVSGRHVALITGDSRLAFPTQEFWHFWPVYWKRPYPPAERAAALHRELVTLYRAFVLHWARRYPGEHAEADALVRAAVAAAFRLWAEQCAAQPKEAADIRAYADRWAPRRQPVRR